jgi:hypothetical protein
MQEISTKSQHQFWGWIMTTSQKIVFANTFELKTFLTDFSIMGECAKGVKKLPFDGT